MGSSGGQGEREWKLRAEVIPLFQPSKEVAGSRLVRVEMVRSRQILGVFLILLGI